MRALRMMLGRGTQGLAAEPMSFATLVLPRAPHACLACPSGDDLPATIEVPVYPVPPAELLEQLKAVAARQPRTTLLGEWPERLQAQWVARSRVANFPDLVTAEAVPVPGGSSLRLYSHSLLGWSDLGVNRARLLRWIGALAPLAAAAPAAVKPEPEPLRRPGEPPLEAALRRCAPGRHVLIAWGDVGEAPNLVVHALASGAASAQVATGSRPPDADALLRRAADFRGRPEVADALLAERAAAGDALPIPHYADTSRMRPWWMLAHLDAPDIRARVGQVDVVVCGNGLMQWCDDPPRRLRDFAATGADWLVIRTACVVLTPGLRAAGFEPGSVWYAGRVQGAQGAALDAALREGGIALPQFALSGPCTREAAHAAGLHGPWLWFMDEAGLSRLLEESGWRTEHVIQDGFFPVLIAKRAP